MGAGTSTGEQRRGDTHASHGCRGPRLFRKGTGKEAMLCFMGHQLMENRSGLGLPSSRDLLEARRHA
jgi:hypothetical protein